MIDFHFGRMKLNVKEKEMKVRERLHGRFAQLGEAPYFIPEYLAEAVLVAY